MKTFLRWQLLQNKEKLLLPVSDVFCDERSFLTSFSIIRGELLLVVTFWFGVFVLLSSENNCVEIDYIVFFLSVTSTTCKLEIRLSFSSGVTTFVTVVSWNGDGTFLIQMYVFWYKNGLRFFFKLLYWFALVMLYF